MKIAYINSVAGYGSTGKLVSMLAKTEGITGKLYYGRKNDTSGCDSFRIIHNPQFVSHVLWTFVTDDHAMHNTRQTEAMIEDLKQFNPYLVHLHNLHGYYLDIRPLFSYLKSSGIPVLWTFHDCWPITGHCAHSTSVHCEQWKTGCKNCPALLHYPPTFYAGNIERNYKLKQDLFTSLPVNQLHIVTPSEWLAGEVRQSFLKYYPIQVIPNGIDQEIFHPVKSSFRNDHHLEGQFVILAVAGNWYKEKGTEDLVKLSKRLPEGCVLVVVGAKGAFARQLANDNVVIIPRTEQASQLAEIYSAADVMINLTQEDTFPTVNIEAISCGCPVVTYKVGGSAEIAGELAGCSVPYGDLDGLIQIIEKMKEGTISFGKEACRIQASQYSRTMMLEEYRHIYEELRKEQR